MSGDCHHGEHITSLHRYTADIRHVCATWWTWCGLDREYDLVLEHVLFCPLSAETFSVSFCQLCLICHQLWRRTVKCLQISDTKYFYFSSDIFLNPKCICQHPAWCRQCILEPRQYQSGDKVATATVGLLLLLPSPLQRDKK